MPRQRSFAPLGVCISVTLSSSCHGPMDSHVEALEPVGSHLANRPFALHCVQVEALAGPKVADKSVCVSCLTCRSRLDQRQRMEVGIY